MAVPKLTPEIAQQITAYVRAGGYPQVAAEAAGVSREMFQTWIQRGQRKSSREPYKSFVLQIRQAQAQARLAAEMKVREDDPKAWLRSGPGKETQENPGWTGIVKPVLMADSRQFNFFASPDFLAFLATVRQVLAPYPKALEALGQAIEGKPPPKQISHSQSTHPADEG